MELLALVPWLLAWGFANLVLLGAALLVYRPLRLGCRHLDVLAVGVLWIVLVTTLVLVTGLAGLLYREVICILSLVGGVTLAVLWRHGRLPWPSPSEAIAACRRFASTLRPAAVVQRFRRHPVEVLFVILVVAQLARLAAHVWYLPPYVWDTLSYHLPNVVEWLQNGRLVIFPTPVDRTFYPANYELFQTWMVLFPHHDVLIDAASIPFYVLCSMAVYSLARLLKLTPRWAVFAALTFAYTPAPEVHATTGNNDLPIALAFLFVTVLLVDFRQRQNRLSARLVLGALALSLAVGTKLYILFLVPGWLVLYLWARRGAESSAFVILRRELGELRSRGSITALATLAASTAGLLAGYWYLRNALVFGNPIYPAGFSLLGRSLLEAGQSAGHEQQGAIGLGNLVENLRLLLGHKIFDAGNELSYSLKDMTGWGWLVFSCGWPALVWGVVRVSALRWLAVAFAAALAGLFTCVTPDPWNLRFALWFPALPVLGFVLALHQLRVPVLRRAWATVAGLALALNFVGTMDIGRLPPWMWQRMASFPVLERSTAALGLYIGRTYFDTLATVPPDEPVAYNVNYNGWIYPLYGAGLDRRIHYLQITPETNVPAALDVLGTRWLFVALPPPVAQHRIDAALAAGQLVQHGEGLYALP